jgi:hypothetical protein
VKSKKQKKKDVMYGDRTSISRALNPQTQRLSLVMTKSICQQKYGENEVACMSARCKSTYFSVYMTLGRHLQDLKECFHLLGHKAREYLNMTALNQHTAQPSLQNGGTCVITSFISRHVVFVQHTPSHSKLHVVLPISGVLLPPGPPTWGTLEMAHVTLHHLRLLAFQLQVAFVTSTSISRTPYFDSTSSLNITKLKANHHVIETRCECPGPASEYPTIPCHTAEC